MPEIWECDARKDPKQLVRRQARTGQVLNVAKATLPAAMVKDIRLEMRHVHREAMATSDPAALSSLISASCRLRDQLADLLSLPKRPASAPAGSRGTIPVSAQVLDAVLSPLDPPNP